MRFGRLYCKAFWAWYDVWFGAYYDRKTKHLYVCLFPCCVFELWLGNKLSKADRLIFKVMDALYDLRLIENEIERRKALREMSDYAKSLSESL